MKLTRKNVEMLLPSADRVVFHRDGTKTAMIGYFYRSIADPKFDRLTKEIQAIGGLILDSGDHYHDFVGGSEVGSTTSSYLWIKFR